MPDLAVRRFALILATFLALAAAPSRAGVSPFPPIDLGTVAVGTAGQYDFTLPLTIPFASIPSSFDAITLYVAADAGEVAALALLGFSSPVTVGQVKAQMPTAAIVLAPPTMSISGITGNIGLGSLGCTATDCSWRVTWNLDTPGDFGAHLEVQVPSVTVANGGLLGVFLTLIYPLLQQFAASYLHYDVEVTAAAPRLPATPVPATGVAALVALGIALAALAARPLARRR